MTNNLNQNTFQLSNIVEFKSKSGLYTAKEILYQKVESKLDLFNNCLNEVGLFKTFTFLDITYKLPFLKKLISTENLQIYPIDKTEEILMRNCVKRNLNANRLIKNFNNIKE